jgi:carbon-monoxide dehydrogenase medium subunit
MPAVLAVLDGAVRVAHQDGERLVPATEFFLGPLESAVEPGELATEALFPVLPPAAGTGFAEVSRRRGDYAVCGVAAIVQLDADGWIVQARTAYLSVGPVPLVLDLTDAAAADQTAAAPRTPAGPAIGSAADPAGAADRVSRAGLTGFPAAADLVQEQVDPEPDIHATANYRRHLAGVLTQRALLEALGEAQVRGTAREGAGQSRPGGTAPGRDGP